MSSERWHRHAWSNRLQTALLVLSLIGITALAAFLLVGPDGLSMGLAACAVALLVEPAASRLTLRLYQARPIHPHAAPDLWRLMEDIARRADLPAVPALYYVPSPLINAFAVGNRRQAAIALTHGLLEQLPPRELAGVLAHETAHIVHGDLRVMGLADYVSRFDQRVRAARAVPRPVFPAGAADRRGYDQLGRVPLAHFLGHTWPCFRSSACRGCVNSMRISPPRR